VEFTSLPKYLTFVVSGIRKSYEPKGNYYSPNYSELCLRNVVSLTLLLLKRNLHICSLKSCKSEIIKKIKKS